MIWKSAVKSVQDLPASGVLGETRIVWMPYSVYQWDGSEWTLLENVKPALFGKTLIRKV
jgi:hypothetical protein